MIKIKLSRPKGTLLVFGLSERNITMLRAGKPIHIDLASIGEKGEVMIFAGDTEESMMKELEKAGLVPAAAAKGPAN